jgi:hypothetical protein
MRIWIVLLVAAVLAIVALGLVQTQKEFVAPCTVKVTGKGGRPIANIRISENWNAYSYDLAGGQDAQTAASGYASFPAQFSKHSVLFWSLSPILTRFNYGAHASSGITATIGVSEPGLRATEGEARGFTCTDGKCIDHPLEFEIKLIGQ